MIFSVFKYGRKLVNQINLRKLKLYTVNTQKKILTKLF